MGLKFIDGPAERITGFGYQNRDGCVESVVFTADAALVELDINGVEEAVYMYKADIPKLIKALQAAYDHKEV